MNKIILSLMLAMCCFTAMSQVAIKVPCGTKVTILDTGRVTGETCSIIKVQLLDTTYTYKRFLKWRFQIPHYHEQDTTITTCVPFTRIRYDTITTTIWCDSFPPVPVDSCEEANNNYEIKTTTNEEIIINAVADYSRHYGDKPKRYKV